MKYLILQIKLSIIIQKANLVITRSGASVLGELINIKIPFIQYLCQHQQIIINIKMLSFMKKKGYGYLLEEKDIKNKLYDLINSIFNDNSLIKKYFINNQRQYSDKDIFKNLNNSNKKNFK